MFAAILTQSGYTVRTAEDGFSALTAIRREVPDLILSDLYMPGKCAGSFVRGNAG
ncbi:MAG: response regulator [Terriglobia bacterium]|nr:response regulator [Terriglobia bacterium]